MKRKVLVRDLVPGRQLAVRTNDELFRQPLWISTDCPSSITDGKFTVSENSFAREKKERVKGPLTLLRKETLKWDYVPDYMDPPQTFPQTSEFYVFATETGQEVYIRLWDLQHNNFTPIDSCGDKCPCCGHKTK